MNDRRFEQAAELVGVLLFVAFVGFAFLVATLVGAVGEHAGRSSSAGEGPTLSDMELGLPDALVLTGGGDGDGTTAMSRSQSPAPASTTTVQARVEGEWLIPPAAATAGPSPYAQVPTNAGSNPAPSATPTVIVSSLPLPASSLEAAVRASVERWFPASETYGTYNVLAVGAAGEEGIFQVRAIYHGPVPRDIDGQVRQAAGIVAQYGWGPWSCR